MTSQKNSHEKSRIGRPTNAIMGFCPAPCGKGRYLTRKAARAAGKLMKKEGHGILSAYRCGEFWHLGHLPAAVKEGTMARAELRADAVAGPAVTG